MIRRVVRSSLRLWSVFGGLGDGLPGWALSPVLDELDLRRHEPPKETLPQPEPVLGVRAVQWKTPDELVEMFPESHSGRRDGMSVGPHLDRLLRGVYNRRFLERYKTSMGDGSNG